MEATDERRRRQLVTALIGVLAVALGLALLPELAGAGPGSPIVITSGGTYSGRYASTDPRTPAVLVATTEPVIIDGATVEGPGTLIQIQVGLVADVTVRNTVGTGTSGWSGRARFLVADSGWRSLVVEHNRLVSTAGIWAHQATPTTVRIAHNQVRDVIGAGFVQFLQFDKVVGPIDVGWNEVINRAGSSAVEDVISLYKSGGTATTPARIHDNFIWGAFPADPAATSFSGGGIMVGDQGSSAGNVVVSGNQVVGTTNYGISVVCGSNQAVIDNTILSSGRTGDGTALPATNVGLSMGSEARWGAGCGTYAGNVAHGNDLGWQRPTGRNDQWVPDCADCSGNVSRSATITYADEQAEYTRWSNRGPALLVGPQPSPVTTTTVAPASTTTTWSTSPSTVAPVPTTTTAPPVDPTTPASPTSEMEALRRELEELRARMQAVEARLDALDGGP